MGDYTPVYVPGRVATMTCSAAVTGGQPLSVSGSGTVAPANLNAAVTPVVGVAAQDTTINGRATIYARGIIHESIANATVTAGQLVTACTSGDTAGAQVKTYAPATLAVQDVGAGFTQGSINTAINAVVAALNALTDREVVGIALTTATNPNKVRWMEA